MDREWGVAIGEQSDLLCLSGVEETLLEKVKEHTGVREKHTAGTKATSQSSGPTS